MSETMHASPLDGNEMQRRIMVESVAEAAVTKFVLDNPTLFKKADTAEIPSPLKWAAGIVAALFASGAGGLIFWLVTSVSAMQITLARMDERQSSQAAMLLDWRGDMERRVSKLETERNDRERK